MMDAGPLEVVLTVLAGMVTGLLSGALGVGGAMVSTPAVRALGVSAAFAVATTLPSVLPSAVSGTLRYSRASLVRWDVVGWTAPAGIVAAVAGARLSGDVPGEGHLLMVATAALLGFSAWRMAADGEHGDDDGDGFPQADRDRPVHRRLLVGIGATAGAMSGLLGVGGGIVAVPAFTQMAGLPVKTAVATSLACVGAFALPATLTHAFVGQIDWATAGWLSLGVVPGARAGAALAVRTSERRLRTAVAVLLGAVAAVYGVSEMVALFRA